MTPIPWRSIQLRVTLFTLGIFVLSIWSLSFFASRLLRDDMQAIVGTQQFSTVTIMAAELNQQLVDRLKSLEDVAASISPATLANATALQTQLEQQVVFQHLFNAGFFVTRTDGIPIADVPVAAKRLGLGVAERDYMVAALQEGRSSVGKPVIGKSLGTPVFSMAAPIRNAYGHVIGVVVGVTNLNAPNFLDRVTGNRYGKSGDYFVASLPHRLNVTSSDKKRVMQALPPVGANPHVDRFVDGYEGTARYVDQRGVEILVSVKGIPAARWAMVATLPTGEAFAPIAAMQQRVLWATVLLTVLAGAVTWWLTWRMLRLQLAPVLAATRSLAAQADAGQLVQALPVSQNNEIGELIAGFNRMLQTLSQRSRALQDSEAYNRVLFAGSHIPMAVIDPQTGTLVDCNQAAMTLYGFNSRERLLAVSPADVSTPQQYDGRDSLQAAMENIQTALHNGAHSFEWRHRRPTGEIWDAFVHVMAFAHAGKPLLQFSLQDITERKRAEADLRVAATAFESQEGMVITDAAMQILRINAACSAITGYALEEVIGKTPRVFSSGRHDAAFYQQLWASIHRTGAWKGEIWNRRKGGEVYPQWAHISAVKGAGGAVTHYVASFIDLSARKSAEDEIRHLAFYDPLTRLPNRRLLLDRLRHAVLAGSRSDSAGALLFIDLDNFKTLNDTLGHDKGDLLLESVAHRLSACVREEDTVARLGGDEFVIMMEGLSVQADDAADHARTVAQKILDEFKAPHDLNGLPYTCTASIGVCLFAHANDTVDELLKRADLAMYQAKAAGRNTLRFFDPQMQSMVMARAALEADLREGLLQRQLVLHYQPQVNADNHITGAEALVRWQHPGRGLVSPAEFIPLAEETGLILALGRHVLESACQQLVAWAADPATAHFTLAVNVSARQFHQQDFVEQVLAVLHATGARPQRLKLELTESLLVSNIEEVIAKMQALRAQGVAFSLDDFGTGYSSLAYLKRMPLEQLKIDQSFVRDVLTDANDAAIAKTIITLAQSLGLGVIAEGVETLAQREFLADSGCRAYQGYYISRPLPIAAFAQFVRAQGAFTPETM
ncbi:MAG: EAL domain-containing protein [Burkholderiales bacterium]|nr:EAL domain-containing protein [Burkholderiales bacterium]